METLINIQEDSYNRIGKVLLNYEKSPNERVTKQYCQSRLEALEKIWDEFLSGHKELIKSVTSDEFKQSSYYVNEVYDLAEECYINYKSMLKTKLSDWEEQEPKKGTTSYTHEANHLVKLHKINIPIFSGRYTEWITFRDLFISLIDKNDSLDDVQKLNYLKGYLSGEAEQLLRHIPITSENYKKCWELLKGRYDNKRFMSHNIIQRMLNQSNAATESSTCLKGLIDTTSECLNALESLGVQVEYWDILVIHILALKLDPETRKQWELHVTSKNDVDLPTFSQFKEFITNRFRSLELIERESYTGQKQNVFSGTRPRTLHAVYDYPVSCRLCSSGTHKLYLCKMFLEMGINNRREYVRNNGVCFNCLGYNHSAKQCISTLKCKVCRRHHHSLLHPTTLGNVGSKGTIAAVEEDNAEKTIESLSTNTAAIEENRSVLLATALIDSQSRNCDFYTLRALLDQGSQASFITEATVQLLGLDRIPVPGLITGVGGSKQVELSSVVQLRLKSRANPELEFQVRAHVLPSITKFLPSRKVVKLSWLPPDCKLADPGYHIPNEVDILLGAELYGQILDEGVMKDPSGSVVAQSTYFVGMDYFRLNRNSNFAKH